MVDAPNTAKYKWCKRILVLTAIVLVMRLFDLQILKGDEMRVLSEQNRIRVRKVIAPRGMVFDRTGKVLADTRPSFNLYLIPEDIRDFNQTVDGLVRLLNLDRDDVLAKIKEARDMPPSFPVKIESDMTMDQVAKVEVNKFYLPGVTIQIEPKRNYPYKQTLAHVLGYVSEISGEEIKSKEYKGYAPGDLIGKFGLERGYEKYLRGIDGEKRVEVDASGKEVRVLDTKEPVSGHSLHLNIDADMQAAADKALEGKKAGVVATDVRTGGVLVLLSKPGFDPNNLSSGVSKDYWKDIATSKAHPLQNRALQGRFPPGSTFKIALALAGLEKGVINDRTTFTCRGGFQFGNHFFRCWKKEGHGTISLHRAIVSSCDVYFYNLGLKLGIDNIHEMGAAIGLTKPTGIDLPGEKVGLIPSSAWKLKTYGEKWYEGETVSVSIGQGAVWLTPLGLMQLAAFTANGGVTFKPQIVNRIVSPEGKVVKVFEPAMLTDVKLRKDTFAQVREGMKGVVNEQGGTAYGSRLQNISMSGKTGTAQSVGMEKGVGKGDHAWFVAYAPSDDPAIAMAVLVEHGGHGATTAAPVAKALTDTFQKQRTETKAAQLDTH